jgi:hypothetical protein
MLDPIRIVSVRRSRESDGGVSSHRQRDYAIGAEVRNPVVIGPQPFAESPHNAGETGGAHRESGKTDKGAAKIVVDLLSTR